MDGGWTEDAPVVVVDGAVCRVLVRDPHRVTARSVGRNWPLGHRRTADRSFLIGIGRFTALPVSFWLSCIVALLMSATCIGAISSGGWRHAGWGEYPRPTLHGVLRN